MTQKFAFGFLISFIVLLAGKDYHVKEVIEFGHLGDQSKPYYKIYFHLNGQTPDSLENETFFVDIQIDSFEMCAIKKLIESNDLIGSTLITEGNYYFSITQNGVRKVYNVGYLEPIKFIFQKVYDLLKKPDIKTKIKPIFDQTLWRLGSKERTHFEKSK